MTSYIIIFFTTLLAPLFELPEIETGQNYIYEKKIELKVSGSKLNDYQIKSNVEVTKIFTIDKKNMSEYEIIPDHVYSTIDKVKAKLNGKKIDKNLVGVITQKYEDEFFSDNITYFINLPFDTNKGDTLKYTYREKHDSFKYPIYEIIPNADSISNFIIEVEHPLELTVNFDFLYFRDTLKYTITHPDEKHTTLTIAPLKGTEVMPYFNFNSNIALVFLNFETKEIEQSYQTPSGFTKWYSTLTDLHPKFESFTDSTLLEEIKSQTTARDKIRFISKYVQENYRYIAIGRSNHSITPFKPDYIFAKKYGDCKDRAALVSALADLVGLEVSIAAVTSISFMNIDIIHPGLFNHAICCFIDQGDTIFFDPTSRFVRFPFVPEALVGSQALVLKDESFVTTLTNPKEPYTMRVELEADYDSLENGRAKFYLRNFYHDEISTVINSAYNNNDLQNLLNWFLSSRIFKVAFSEFEVDTAGSYEVVVTSKVDLSDLIISSPSRKYFPKTIFAAFDPEMTKRTSDHYPIHFIASKNFICDISLNNFTDTTISDSLVLDYGTSGYFHSKTTTDSSRLLINYEFKRPEKILSGAAKIDHINFCKEYNGKKSNMYIITKQGK